MQTVWPKSRIIVMPPLPSKNRQYIQLRDAYSTMVARHPGVFMSLCGAGLNPTNKQHYRDGVHPVEGGFEILFNCLKGQVAWKLSEYNSRA